MKRLVCAALAVTFLGLAAPTDSSAQATIVAAAGATFPMSTYGDFAKTGWLGHAGVNFPVGTGGVAVGAHGYYGSNSHETDGDKTNLYGAVASLGYALSTSGSVVPQIFAVVGTMTHQFKSESFPAFEGSSTSLAAGGGANIGFPLGGISGSVGAWFMTGFGDNDETRVVGVDVGIGIPVGGGGM